MEDSQDNTVPANGAANGHSNAEPSLADNDRKPFKPQYPLTSWANTQQNAVCVAFILGAVFAVSLRNVGQFASNDTLLADQWQGRLYGALQNPRLGVYVALLVVFHMSEYLTTAIWNPQKATVRSFLLDDRNHNAAHAFALLEFLLEETFFPQEWLAIKHSSWTLWIGLSVALLAQTLRSSAMITAASNFSHLVAYTKAPEHSLVRSGVYAWSRHPSYVAFFYWALSTQVFIGNPLSILAFGVVLYRFFSHRIKGEYSRLLPNGKVQLT
ncbi:farnesyl cysteine-carboxyl methyltransferase [Cystobasidiomycetes sp. EMM_F5]